MKVGHCIIETDGDVQRGIDALRVMCPILRGVHDVVGMPPLRRHPDGFAGLAKIVVGQQLSIASAAAIWGRLEHMVRPFEITTFCAAADADLRTAGLSAPKIRTLRAICGTAGLDFKSLRSKSDLDVRETLTAISGIGPWTADIYLMFCMGRADAWASGDLALQLAAKSAYGLHARPTAADLEALADAWRPWRSVAARLLWAHYAVEKRAAKRSPL